MSAIHELEDTVIKRLHTHAYAVHPKSKQSLDIGLSLLHDIFRVHLDCKFFVWSSVADFMEG